MRTLCAGMIGAALLVLGAAAPAPADQDGGLAREVQALRQAVEQLKVRVASLEALKPSFATFMPQFSERFHIMHQAGDAGDWAVATHELLELKRMVQAAEAIDTEKGRLMASFMNGSLEKINGAIEHGSQKRFRTAMEETVANCNACHQAVGSKFIRVGLNPGEYLTMRHSHKLQPSKSMGPHTHTH